MSPLNFISPEAFLETFLSDAFLVLFAEELSVLSLLPFIITNAPVTAITAQAATAIRLTSFLFGLADGVIS